MRKFLSDFVHGPKHWSEFHGLFAFFLVATPLALVFAWKMTGSGSKIEKALRAPDVPLGRVREIRHMTNGGLLGESVYTEVVCEKRVLLLQGSFTNLGDSVTLVNQGLSYALCTATKECYELVPSGGTR